VGGFTTFVLINLDSARRESSHAAPPPRGDCRLIRARPTEGDLRYHVDPGALSRHLCTIVQRVSVHASNGMPEAELRGLIDIVFEMWPSS
jgi:hypothetical protein